MKRLLIAAIALYAGYRLYELYDALPENLGGWW
jgi:hypothetical protein